MHFNILGRQTRRRRRHLVFSDGLLRHLADDCLRFIDIYYSFRHEFFLITPKRERDNSRLRNFTRVWKIHDEWRGWGYIICYIAAFAESRCNLLTDGYLLFLQASERAFIIKFVKWNAVICSFFITHIYTAGIDWDDLSSTFCVLI